MSKQLLINADDSFYSFLAMINDTHRNQFYERMLQDKLQNLHVVDVGFGTGFLSLLSLKHGAKLVDAFEQRIGLFEFGQQLISELEYQSKIKLHNSRFYSESLKGKFDCLVHEVMGENIWSEYLYYIIKDVEIPIFPNVYRLDIKCFPLSENYNRDGRFSFQQPSTHFKYQPGVTFTDEIMQKKQKTLNYFFQSIEQNSVRDQDFDLKYMPPLKTLTQLCHYEFDHNKKQLLISDTKGKTIQHYQSLPQFVELSFTFPESGFYGIWLDFQFGDSKELFSTCQQYSSKHWEGFADGGNPIVMKAEANQKYNFSQDISNGQYIFSKN